MKITAVKVKRSSWIRKLSLGILPEYVYLKEGKDYILEDKGIQLYGLNRITLAIVLGRKQVFIEYTHLLEKQEEGWLKHRKKK